MFSFTLPNSYTVYIGRYKTKMCNLIYTERITMTMVNIVAKMKVSFLLET